MRIFSYKGWHIRWRSKDISFLISVVGVLHSHIAHAQHTTTAACFFRRPAKAKRLNFYYGAAHTGRPDFVGMPFYGSWLASGIYKLTNGLLRIFSLVISFVAPLFLASSGKNYNCMDLNYATPLKKRIMNKNGPIIIIEDDADDQEILTEVFNKLNYSNKIVFFFDGEKALDYINQTDVLPFLILSDINMPKLDGFALRSKLKTDAELRIKCIPYLFFSTAINQRAVIDAYSLSVQGFFVKDSSIAELEKTISVIMEYWKKCAAPNDF